eukprot:TRINITY_DN3333_c1_g1_i2.p1 TRINITY_DN3333_c1_g1~~TRINITY_DN3333_c1_g1_i2.p1  ORF type:complete len:381 (+),score=52.56 TRINITY_DN3333_c1_g1_i2:391-1533(+)
MLRITLPRLATLYRRGADSMSKSEQWKQNGTIHSVLCMGDSAVSNFISNKYEKFSLQRSKESSELALFRGWLKYDLTVIQNGRTKNIGPSTLHRFLTLFNKFGAPKESIELYESQTTPPLYCAPYLKALIKLNQVDRAIITVSGWDAHHQRHGRYKKNSRVDIKNIILEGLAKTDKKRCRAAFNQMKTEKLINKGSILQYVKCCTPSEAVHLANDLKKIDVELFSVIIHSCTRTGGVVEARSIWRKLLPKVDGPLKTSTYNAMLSVARAASDYTFLMSWHEKMKSEAIPPDPHTYAISIMCLSECSSSPQDEPAVLAIALFDHSVLSGFVSNPKIVGALASLHAKHNDVRRMTALEKHIKTHNVPLTSVLSGYISSVKAA